MKSAGEPFLRAKNKPRRRESQEREPGKWRETIELLDGNPKNVSDFGWTCSLVVAFTSSSPSLRVNIRRAASKFPVVSACRKRFRFPLTLSPTETEHSVCSTSFQIFEQEGSHNRVRFRQLIELFHCRFKAAVNLSKEKSGGPPKA